MFQMDLKYRLHYITELLIRILLFDFFIDYNKGRLELRDMLKNTKYLIYIRGFICM